jgi:hypothetical protein
MWTAILEVAVIALIAVVLFIPRRTGMHTAANGDPPRRWAGRIAWVLFAAAFLNFLAYSVHSGNLGGSAGDYKRDEGRYYVSAHGRHTEVTEDQWRAIRAHQIAVFVTHPLALLVGVPLMLYAQRGRPNDRGRVV